MTDDALQEQPYQVIDDETSREADKLTDDLQDAFWEAVGRDCRRPGKAKELFDDTLWAFWEAAQGATEEAVAESIWALKGAFRDAAGHADEARPWEANVALVCRALADYMESLDEDEAICRDLRLEDQIRRRLYRELDAGSDQDEDDLELIDGGLAEVLSDGIEELYGFLMAQAAEDVHNGVSAAEVGQQYRWALDRFQRDLHSTSPPEFLNAWAAEALARLFDRVGVLREDGIVPPYAADVGDRIVVRDGDEVEDKGVVVDHLPLEMARAYVYLSDLDGSRQLVPAWRVEAIDAGSEAVTEVAEDDEHPVLVE